MIAKQHEITPSSMATSLETDFPIVNLSQLAEQESWRKEINRPIYHIHKWWATRLGSVFRAITLGALMPSGTPIWEHFYASHHLSDKVVLDPFMGSGTTLGEAVKLGAKAIGCDINPISTFLVRQAFTAVPEATLRQTFAHLEAQIAARIRSYYQTRDPQTGELIPVLYYFWVKTVTTPNGLVVPLFSRYVFAQDAYPKKKPRAQVICPHCWMVFEDRYDATDATCCHCDHHFNPQIGPASGTWVTAPDGERYKIKDLTQTASGPPAHRLYAMMALRPTGEKIYLSATADDHDRYAEAEVQLASEVLPLPTLQVRPGHNTDQARGYNYVHWRDFFNARQLLCLGLLLKAILEIDDVVLQEQLLCLFSSTLEFNNLFCSFKGEGTGAVRHMFSHHILKPERTPIENSVWGTEKSSGTFCTLFESRLLRAKRYLDTPFDLAFTYDMFGSRTGTSKIVASPPIIIQPVESWDAFQESANNLLVLNGNSAALPIPSASVDAVVTDPPYFDFVHYSELSDFFFAWLAPVLEARYPWFARPDSSAPGEVQQKDPRQFAELLATVFTECHRVLKDAGVLAFSFHHSRPEGWVAIYEAIRRAGFMVVAAHPVHAEFRGANPKAGAQEPISIDAILVCKKQGSVPQAVRNRQDILDQARDLARTLREAGMTISRSDEFVIGASQTLIGLADANVEEVGSLIQAIEDALHG